ncbi:MAG: HD domain-containing protein [Thermoguttaceae bacterium]|nr:HD domain-containing protein [Thermoguttaceae bacterium]
MLVLSTRYASALAWICEIHAHQRRKFNQDPYISHLLRVSGMVLEWAETEDEAIAALLHDAAEDCGGQKMLDEIQNRYGERVARWVALCSDSLTENPEVKRPWRERKEAHIAHARAADFEARQIMLCDKIDNLRGVLGRLELEGESTFAYFRGGREIQWYFREMLEALSPGQPEILVRELRRNVELLEKY